MMYRLPCAENDIYNQKMKNIIHRMMPMIKYKQKQGGRFYGKNKI